MGVSKNRGTPKSWILIGFSIIYHPFWGTPIFGIYIIIYIYIYICIHVYIATETDTHALKTGFSKPVSSYLFLRWFYRFFWCGGNDRISESLNHSEHKIYQRKKQLGWRILSSGFTSWAVKESKQCLVYPGYLLFFQGLHYPLTRDIGHIRIPMNQPAFLWDVRRLPTAWCGSFNLRHGRIQSLTTRESTC